jgi:hypothetical protein
MARKRIQWPFKGRVDNNARGDQPELTTSDAKNVRNYAAGTERMQGGQRPGLSKLATTQPNGSNAVRAIKSLVYDRPPFTYSQLEPPTDSDWESVNSTDTSTTDVYVDESGNSYWLTTGAIIEKRNPSGELIWSQAIPGTGTLTLRERFSVDPEGNVYLILTGGSGSLGRLIRMAAREDDDGLDFSYAEPLQQTDAVDVLYRAGTVFVAVNAPGSRSAYIYGYTAVEGEQPVLSATYVATYPIRQIGFSKGGLVYCSAPEVDRASSSGAGGVDPGEVSWTPLELSNAQFRMHAWIDARGEPSSLAGVEVTIPDRRQEYIDYNDGLGYTEPEDDTNRDYTVPHDSYGGRLPTIDPNGGILYPAYRFDPSVGIDPGSFNTNNTGGAVRTDGSGVISDTDGAGDGLRDKLTTSDKLNRSHGLWPQTILQSWATTFVVRCASDEKMVLWLMNARRNKLFTSGSGAPDAGGYLALCLNGAGGYSAPNISNDRGMYIDGDGATLAQNALNASLGQFDPISGSSYILDQAENQPGNAVLVQAERGFDGNNLRDLDKDEVVVSHKSSGSNNHGVQVEAQSSATDDPQRVYIVTVICAQPATPTPGALDIHVRCNGVASSDHGHIRPTQFSDEGFTESVFGDALGTRYLDQDTAGTYPFGSIPIKPQTGRQLAGGYSSFDGWICEAITYFSDSSSASSPHDAALGTISGANTFSTFYDEIVAVEGYMAHKWGVASRLDSGHVYKSAPPTGSGDQVESDVDGSSIQSAIQSPLGITAKLNIVTGEHYWAYAGAGMGYGITVDGDDGIIYTIGPKDVGYSDTATTQVNYDFGATQRKIVDAGSFARIRRAGYGSIRFFDVPQTGQSLDLTQDGTTISIEFAATTSTTAPYRSAVTAGDLDATLTELVSTINTIAAAQSYDYYAIKGDSSATGTQVIRIYDTTNDLSSPETVTFAVDMNSAATTFEIYHPMFASLTGVKSGIADESAWTYIEDNGVDPNPEDIQSRGAIDADNAVYMPRTGVGSSATKSNHVRYWPSKPNATQVAVGNAPTSDGWTYVLDTTTTTDYEARSVGLKPELEHIWPDSTITGPEYMWIANDNVKGDGTVTSDLPTVSRVALVGRTASNQNVRNVQTFAVAGQNAYRLTDAGAWSDTGQVASSSGSAFMQMVPAFGQMFFVDNGLYKVWDPIKGGGTLEDWTAETAGEIPEGCRLVSFYRGRLVVARSDREPNMIFSSAVGDPYDWDFFPKVSKPTKAFGGASQDTARNPDVVNALAPFYDDVLLVGGDHSITQYRGDLSELGQIDYFTDVTGMAFGNSWALSPEGLMYFFGSRGGVWVMSPRSDGRTQPPIELTRDTIAEELRSIDLSQYLPKLVWDQECQGLHVFITPLTGSVSATTQHWFWEARTKSWWPQEFNATTLQPYSGTLLEALTPTDRRVAIGCDDGYVRVVDKSASDDDGTAIESDVLIGPIFAPDTPAEQRISSLHAIVANIGAGCRYTLYASDNPESLGTAVASGNLAAGYNDRVPARARGGYIWIKLESATGGGQWALESLHADLHLAGRRRDR